MSGPRRAASWELTILTLAMAAVGGCAEEGAGPGQAAGASEAMASSFQEGEAPDTSRDRSDRSSRVSPWSDPGRIPPGEPVATEAVEGWTGPGNRPFEVADRTGKRATHLHRRIGRETFALGLRLRDPELTQYPCSSCHADGLPPVDPQPRTDDAHHNVRPVHPDGKGDVCTTCHVADDVERLTVGESETVDLTHSYRLCAQCHSAEVEAWAGGAHGKQVNGWQGPRVVMGCADCHDPHDPALEPRIPYPGPRLPPEDQP